MKLFLLVELICAGIAVLCGIAFLFLFFFSKRNKGNKIVIPKSEEKADFAVLIPARNESKVIEGNLRAIYSSDYPTEKLSVYVIVESESDPTVEICKRINPEIRVFIRRDLTKAMKGYAIDECVKDIFERGEIHDAFIILDADNVISKEFFGRMSDAYMAGFDAATGKRNNKDWNSSVVSSASGLTFSVINTLQNKPKSERGMNIMFSGTGFYVKYDVLRGLGGWPFASLTEDYEFSNYALINHLKTVYVEDAVYYDEQPVTLRQSIVQRTRWVRGFFHVRKVYKNAKRDYSRSCPKSSEVRAMKFGTVPLLVIAFDIIAYIVSCIAMLLYSGIARGGYALFALTRLLIVLCAVYFVIFIFTAFVFSIEGDSIDITEKNKIKTLFYHPIFLSTYVVSALRCLFIKDKWEVIEHISKDVKH